jgi:hypothetical protein
MQRLRRRWKWQPQPKDTGRLAIIELSGFPPVDFMPDLEYIMPDFKTDRQYSLESRRLSPV